MEKSELNRATISMEAGVNRYAKASPGVPIHIHNEMVIGWQIIKNALKEGIELQQKLEEITKYVETKYKNFSIREDTEAEPYKATAKDILDAIKLIGGK
jgi:hypothetical protein